MRKRLSFLQFLESSKIPGIRKPRLEEEEEADLRSFDIGLMPLSVDLWSQGRCGLKILQYFGMGLPVFYTPVRINQDIVQDGLNGFLAENESQREDRLLRMIQGEGWRKEMRFNNRKVVERPKALRSTLRGY